MSEITREQVEKYVARVRAEYDRMAHNRACYEAIIDAWERSKHKTCRWKLVSSSTGRWATGCGRVWDHWRPGSTTGVYHCFHCGRTIEEVKG